MSPSQLKEFEALISKIVEFIDNNDLNDDITYCFTATTHVHGNVHKVLVQTNAATDQELNSVFDYGFAAFAYIAEEQQRKNPPMDFDINPN